MVAARAPELKDTVARGLYKLMAYKDEYEVARLLLNPMPEIWESVESVSYNLHPPLLRRLGVKRKLKLGPWFRLPLRALAACKVLRGTPLDLFGLTTHRREERGLIDWYRRLIEEAIQHPTQRTLELAALPDQIRGYEHIKEESIRRVKQLAADMVVLQLVHNDKADSTLQPQAGPPRSAR
jgi:indolepyruvate ferredoxin oxidoreductase